MNQSFRETVEMFNDWVITNEENEIINYIRRENSNYSYRHMHDLKEVPNRIHFIWLGSIDRGSLEYLNIWKEIGVNVTLWVDSQTKYNIILSKIINRIMEKYDIDLIKAQNVFFKFSRSINALSLDEAVFKYVEMYLPCIRCDLTRVGIEYQTKISLLSESFTVKDISEHSSVFFDDSFRIFYLYETILRNNLAAASDIVRLCILWCHGGVYIDVDTLPFINVSYDTIRKKHEIPTSILNIIDVYVSHSLIVKHGFNVEIEHDKFNYCKSIISATSYGLIDDLDSIIDNDLCFSSFTLPLVHESLISISASKNNQNEFNNNIIACHPRSRTVRVILREMKKRYRYCEKNGIIFHNKRLMEKQEDTYYNRLMNYRTDGICKGDEATLILSGPSLILEVLLGASYKLARLSERIHPISVSYALSVKKFCLSYDTQTMFTLKHINSSWMAK
jgi:hypothetical protein